MQQEEEIKTPYPQEGKPIKPEKSNLSFMSQSFVPTHKQDSTRLDSAFSSDNYSAYSEASSTQFKPSRVIFVRGLPLDTCEQELIRILSKFGTIEKTLLLISKAQAFIQFSTLEQAKQCLQNQEHIYLHNKKLHLSYSGRDQISEDRVDQQGSDPNKILLVTITNIKFPVNADVLYTVFNKYGDVHKVVIFQRQLGEQALVEMGSIEAAKEAKAALDGKNIYSSTNMMRVQYSSLPKLEINQQNDRARDFQAISADDWQSTQDKTFNNDILSKDEFMKLFNKAHVDVSSTSKNNYQFQPIQSQNITRMTNPLVDPNELEDNSIFTHGLDSFGLSSIKGPFAQTTNPSLGQVMPPRTQGSKVLIVSNLPKDTSPYLLFKLFGVYGNVMKVKIMFKKRDNALIEFQDESQAQLAKQYLNGVPFFSTQLNVNDSKITSIAIPHSSSEEAKLTQDFTQSKEHRFKIQGSKNVKNITPPSVVLHLSNFSKEMANEASIRYLFSQVAAPKQLKFFESNGKDMAFAKFMTLQEAVRVLVLFHNYDINGKQVCSKVDQASVYRHLKISFSKTNI